MPISIPDTVVGPVGGAISAYREGTIAALESLDTADEPVDENTGESEASLETETDQP